MADRKYWCFCDSNCKFETMTKEQIITAIMQAVNKGTIGDVDCGFITTVKTINGNPLRFFVGSQSEYEALTDEEKVNLFAIITNDTTMQGINEAIEQIAQELSAVSEKVNDVVETSYAENAGHAKNADHATSADSATSAGHATSADKADSATSAGHATSADKADSATSAGHATSADKADKVKVIDESGVGQYIVYPLYAYSGENHNQTTPRIDKNFYYDPSERMLVADRFSGLADSADNAIESQKAHELILEDGWTEYVQNSTLESGLYVFNFSLYASGYFSKAYQTAIYIFYETKDYYVVVGIDDGARYRAKISGRKVTVEVAGLSDGFKETASGSNWKISYKKICSVS